MCSKISIYKRETFKRHIHKEDPHKLLCVYFILIKIHSNCVTHSYWFYMFHNENTCVLSSPQIKAPVVHFGASLRAKTSLIRELLSFKPHFEATF